MYDWGFWIVDSTSGANVSNSWNVFEGWTVHVNATSLPPNVAVGGTAYHGLGIELNATGQQLMSLAAPVGQWVSASFIAPNSAYFHQHIWCTIECGPGHSSQQEYILNIIPAVPLPVAVVSANATLGPAPFSVSFTGNASSGTAPYNLTWSFGDGTAAAYGGLVSHTYTVGGVYYATLTVTDAKGNQGRAAATITVLSSSPLTATLSVEPVSGVAPFSASLSAVAHGGTPPYTFQWEYGDSLVVNGPNATVHLYASPGVFASSVEVTDSAGAHYRAIASVVVRPATGTLTVSAVASPANGTAPLSTTLTSNATGGSGPYSYSWVLGDGSATTGASVPHVYNQTGSYEATVFVVDSAGKSGMATANVVVTGASGGGGGGGGDGGGGDNVPTAAVAPAAAQLTLHLLTTPPEGGEPLTLHAIASVENGTGLGENLTWTFGDGGTATGQVASHTYSALGTYSVSVSATDSSGNAGNGTASVFVGGPSLVVVLNASAGDTPYSVEAGATLVGGSGTWGAVSWTWGDGTNGSGDVADHAYPLNLSGTFTIEASATDSSGSAVSGKVSVVVTGPPTAAVSAVVPTASGLPVTVSFTIAVTGGTGNYSASVLWTFGDLTSTRGPYAETHSYNRSGHYLVTVETNDSSGRIALASTWVNISSALALPHLRAGPTPWVFTGVPDPATAALAMMGLVGATGLGFLLRKRKKRRGASTTGRAGSQEPTSGSARSPNPDSPGGR
jgi:PKD repeat protein